MKIIKGVINNLNVETENIIQNIGNRIKLHGSIYKVRKMSGFAFVLLRTKRAVIQCLFSEEFSKFNLDILKEESCIKLNADVVKEERSKTGWELHMIDVEILSEPIAESPIVLNNKKVDTSLENLLDYRPITLRNEKERAIFKIQEGICNGFVSFC